MKKDARYTAAQALMRQSGADAYSNIVIDALIRQNGLDGRDAAFASALFYGTLERLLTIDHILRRYSSKPLERLSPEVLAALRGGLCQLCYMDGVDDYAAVSESVNLTRELGCAKASGFVNGVLRSFVRDGKRVPPAQGTRAQRLEVEYSCPAWLIERWTADYGEAAALRMLKGSLGKPPVYLRANTTRLDAGALCGRLAAEGVEALPDDALEGCVTALGRVAVEALPSFGEGLFHVQDRASQLCAAALGARPGERVLDVCSAPGGKAFTVAERMEDRGEVVALDLHPKRVKLISDGARRLGLAIVRAGVGDASAHDPALGIFDRVLCDVPCSGFGIIRRKPEIKYKPPESVRALPEIQYKILQNSSQYLRDGGTLVYSTCTLLPEENERVVERFLAANGAFALRSQRTFTGEDADTDGFFISVLTKR